MISRFNYLEQIKGAETVQKFQQELSGGDVNFVRQPIIGANNYPEHTITEMDKMMLADIFNGDVNEFFRLGEWNSREMMLRFFNLYIDDQDAVGFVQQFARLRSVLIGSGEMTVERSGKTAVMIQVDYGQKIPRSVCLSEQGFISGGMKLCGMKTVTFEEICCAGLEDESVCKYKVKYSK